MTFVTDEARSSAVVFELMRSRRLQERYALLWILTGIVVFVLAVWRSLLGWAAGSQSRTPR
jgi:hypothetical protein